MKPRIGISMNYRTTSEGIDRAYLDAKYFDVLAELGAVPVPIIPTDNTILLGALLRDLHGVLFSGGIDLDPALYNQPQHEETQLVHPRRQRFEFMLYEHTRKRQLPIFGICLGIQMINVAHGGTLHQSVADLEQALPHEPDENDGPCTHRIRIRRKSKLHQWLRTDELVVPSHHRQAVAQLGKGLQAVAIAEDGLVEALELTNYPFGLAVQWHPESAVDEPVNRIILKRFLAAAAHQANNPPKPDPQHDGPGPADNPAPRLISRVPGP